MKRVLSCVIVSLLLVGCGAEDVKKNEPDIEFKPIEVETIETERIEVETIEMENIITFEATATYWD